MEMSVREARANFAQALDRAEKGESVTITKNGKPVAQLGPPVLAPKGSVFDRLRAASEAAGWDDSALVMPDDFDDPAFSRRVLGLDD